MSPTKTKSFRFSIFRKMEDNSVAALYGKPDGGSSESAPSENTPNFVTFYKFTWQHFNVISQYRCSIDSPSKFDCRSVYTLKIGICSHPTPGRSRRQQHPHSLEVVTTMLSSYYALTAVEKKNYLFVSTVILIRNKYRTILHVQFQNILCFIHRSGLHILLWSQSISEQPTVDLLFRLTKTKERIQYL